MAGLDTNRLLHVLDEFQTHCLSTSHGGAFYSLSPCQKTVDLGETILTAPTRGQISSRERERDRQRQLDDFGTQSFF